MKSLRLWGLVIEEFRFQQILFAEMIIFVILLNVGFDKSSGGFSIVFIGLRKGLLRSLLQRKVKLNVLKIFLKDPLLTSQAFFLVFPRIFHSSALKHSI